MKAEARAVPPAAVGVRSQVTAPAEKPVSKPPAWAPSFQLYGLYGGPGWTAGSFGGTDFSVKSINELDEIYREHDYLYTVTTRADADGYTARRLQEYALRTGHPTALASAAYFTLVGAPDSMPHVFPWKQDGVEPHPPDTPYPDDFTVL